MDKYEINGSTMAIIGIDEFNSKVIEKNKDYIISSSAYEVMEDSCKYFGSSYSGRVEGSKNLTGYKYKLPIIVSEIADLIFFPITTIDNPQCVWINLNYYDKIVEKNSFNYIYFKNNKYLKTNVSKYSISNQVLRSSKLHYILSNIRNKY